jgi:hypothetical protein
MMTEMALHKEQEISNHMYAHLWTFELMCSGGKFDWMICMVVDWIEMYNSTFQYHSNDAKKVDDEFCGK